MSCFLLFSLQRRVQFISVCSCCLSGVFPTLLVVRYSSSYWSAPQSPENAMTAIIFCELIPFFLSIYSTVHLTLVRFGIVRASASVRVCAWILQFFGFKVESTRAPPTKSRKIESARPPKKLRNRIPTARPRDPRPRRLPSPPPQTPPQPLESLPRARSQANLRLCIDTIVHRAGGVRDRLRRTSRCPQVISQPMVSGVHRLRDRPRWICRCTVPMPQSIGSVACRVRDRLRWIFRYTVLVFQQLPTGIEFACYGESSVSGSSSWLSASVGMAVPALIFTQICFCSLFSSSEFRSALYLFPLMERFLR